MKRLPALIVGLFTLWLCSSVDAGCNVVRRVVNNHHAAYDPVLVAEYVPVAYPAYALTYVAPQDEAAGLRLEIRLLKQELELAALRAELATFKGGPVPQRGQPTIEPDIKQKQPQARLSATNTACASCHDRTGRPAGAPQFFDGGILTATAEQRLEMIDAVMTERMPRGKKTDDETATRIMAELAKIKKST